VACHALGLNLLNIKKGKRMKKCLIMPVVLLCTACVSVANTQQETPEQIKQNAEIFAKELENSKDPVEVMDAYIKYFQNSVECRSAGYNIYCYGTKMPDACDGQNEFSSHDCQIASALAEPGTKFGCLVGYECMHMLPDFQEYCSGGKQSDECILYRRKLHETEVAYFDYRRFLGNNTRIKNDEAFLRFANAYAKNTGCEKELETTTLEKQGCKERRDNFFRQAVKQKIHCRDFVEMEYRELLKDARSSYNFYREYGESHSKAIEHIKEVTVDTFSKMYLCDVSGWQKEIFK